MHGRGIGGRGVGGRGVGGRGVGGRGVGRRGIIYKARIKGLQFTHFLFLPTCYAYSEKSL